MQAMLNIESGESVLYVGDHLYSDVLRSKRTLGWRTALIVPELDDEIKAYKEEKEDRDVIEVLRNFRKTLAEETDRLRHEITLGGEAEMMEKAIEECEEKDKDVKKLLGPLADKHHKKFNGVWGQLFKAGYQDSR